MKSILPLAAMVAGALLVVACDSQPVHRVDVPSATDPASYQPQPYPKPMPPAGYDPGMQQPNPAPATAPMSMPSQ